jgi:hypothetical protein
MIDRGEMMRRWILLAGVMMILSACQSDVPVLPTKLPNPGSVGIVLHPTKTATITPSAVPSTRTPAPTPTRIPPIAVATLLPQFWLDAGVSPDTPLASMTGSMFNPIGQIGTARVDGTAFQPLTVDQYNWMPLLSPDQQRIAYQSFPHSATPSAQGRASWPNVPSEIWVANIDGQQTWQLTEGDAKRKDLVWSPDSQRVAFVDGSNSLVEIEVDNKTRHEIVAGASKPRYQPKGKGIGYITIDGGLAWYQDSVVHTIVATSTLPFSTTVHDFDWLPDGQHVIFTLMDKSQQKHPGVPFGIEYSVWVTSIDQFTPTKLADGIHDLEVAPNSSYIAALRGSGYGDVCVINWHPVFLLLSPDLKSMQVMSAENRAALPPEEQHNVFTDLYRTSWISDHVAKVTIFTCKEANEGAGYKVTTRTYIVDLAKQVMVEVGSENQW